MNVRRLRTWLLAFVLFGGAFSLHPSIQLSVFDFSSFRIGLYQGAAGILVLTSLPLLWKRRGTILHNRKLLLLATLLGSSLLVGVILAGSFMRSALYSVSLVSLLAIGLSAGVVYDSLDKRHRKQLVTIGLWSGVAGGVIAIGQLALANIEPTAFGTLCRGCVADVFGFVRITAFAAEPQFFASSMLPALFIAFWQSGGLAKASLFFSSIAITLTFSRGAFVAITGALFISWAIRIASKSPKMISLRSVTLMIGGMLVGFGLLISSAVLRHHNTPHIAHNTIVSMVEHLSLGVISLPQYHEPILQPSLTIAAGTPVATFTPAGYVEASSDERLSAADLALIAWSDTPRTILFGVGLGNLGAYLQQLGNVVPTDQTVYIMYILLLSSVGIIGIIPLLAALGAALWHYRWPLTPWTVSGLLILIALTLHFWFFGSLINTVHCFAWVGVLLYNYRDNYAKKL